MRLFPLGASMGVSSRLLRGGISGVAARENDKVFLAKLRPLFRGVRLREGFFPPTAYVEEKERCPGLCFSPLIRQFGYILPVAPFRDVGRSRFVRTMRRFGPEFGQCFPGVWQREGRLKCATFA